MKNSLKLTDIDIAKYRKEIDNIDINEKDEILTDSLLKLNELFEDNNLDQFQLILVQEINFIHSILKTKSNLEQLVQQKIIFALKYFIKGNDDIPDDISKIGFLDDLAIVDWVIQDIKNQYSHYFQA